MTAKQQRDQEVLKLAMQVLDISQALRRLRREAGVTLTIFPDRDPDTEYIDKFVRNINQSDLSLSQAVDSVRKWL